MVFAKRPTILQINRDAALDTTNKNMGVRVIVRNDADLKVAEAVATSKTIVFCRIRYFSIIINKNIMIPFKICIYIGLMIKDIGQT
jgi:hypothetical protein